MIGFMVMHLFQTANIVKKWHIIHSITRFFIFNAYFCALNRLYMDHLSATLSQYHILGLVVGLATFLIIGIFHPLVIQGEYHFGVKCWWAFLVLGIAGCALSVFVTNSILSILCGVIAFSSFWSIGEVFQQRERVRKGWFPKKPGRD